jgi:hypothetical protein
VGFPTTWPASWIFAARYDTSPATFDLAAGKYLFYRQNNLGGIADLGSEGDLALVVDGFTAPRQDGPTSYRRLDSAARLVVSLDLPETLDLEFAARADQAAGANVQVALNGVTIGAFSLTPTWDARRVHAPMELWKRGPNVVTLRSSSPVLLDQVAFVRPSS